MVSRVLFSNMSRKENNTEEEGGRGREGRRRTRGGNEKGMVRGRRETVHGKSICIPLQP